MIICSNCNKQIPGDSSFCPNCGAKIEQASNYNSAAAEVSPVQVSNRKSKKIIIPMAIIGIVVVLGLFIFPKFGAKPETTVVNFFEAIQEADTEKFLDTLSNSLRNELLYETDWNMVEIASELYFLNQEAEYELGKNWVKQINVSLVYEDDNNAVVNMTLKGESETVSLIKEDGKWKIYDFPW